MFSKHFRKDQHFSETGFRYRGLASSRLEHLTDAVFAFAITLLVIASEVPKTYVELQASMYGFLGFIACILLIFSIWSNHSSFFMHYGMQDTRTRTLNFLFLFVLLFYIYPLKYLFSYLGSIIFLNIMHHFGGNTEILQLAISKVQGSALNTNQWQDLMVRFGLGLMLIYGILGFMHLNALKRKKELELNKREEFETKTNLLIYGYLVFISFSSMLFVGKMGGDYSGIGGFFYLTIPIILTVIKKKRLKRMNKIYPLNIENLEEEVEIEPPKNTTTKTERLKPQRKTNTKKETVISKKITPPTKGRKRRTKKNNNNKTS